MYNVIVIDNRPKPIDYVCPYSTFFIAKDLTTAICYFTKKDGERFDFKSKKEAKQVANDFIKVNNIELSEELQVKVIKNNEITKWV